MPQIIKRNNHNAPPMRQGPLDVRYWGRGGRSTLSLFVGLTSRLAPPPPGGAFSVALNGTDDHFGATSSVSTHLGYRLGQFEQALTNFRVADLVICTYQFDGFPLDQRVQL